MVLDLDSAGCHREVTVNLFERQYAVLSQVDRRHREVSLLCKIHDLAVLRQRRLRRRRRHHSDSTVNVQVVHATDESVEHRVGAVEVYLGRQNQLCSVVDDEAAGCLRAVAH